MHRPETKTEKRWKFYATNQVHEHQWIQLNGEFIYCEK
jgi:hypothetical protein